VNKHLYLCHLLVLSSPTLMMHGHTNLKSALRNSSETEADDSDKVITINNNYNIIIINNNNNLKHVKERVLTRGRFRPISTTIYTHSQQA